MDRGLTGPSVVAVAGVTAAAIAWVDGGAWLGAAPTAVAAVALPIALGALIGVALRRVRGRRSAGVVAAISLIAVPVLLVTAVVVRFPLMGLWDALLEGGLLGAGALWTAHRAFADQTGAVLAVASLVVSLVVLELVCRAVLPPPPGFPTGAGTHFWLADAMRADAQNPSWDLRSKEIVCSVLYEQQYPGILDVSGERDIIIPRTFTPRADATRHVLHIGDSMTFGFGVPRDQTFTADLERLEPGTQHINGGIPGTAPDAYLVVLRRWLALHDVDLAVMYVFEGNDLAGLDDHYPCCGWQSLLTYGPDGLAMRCATPTLDFGKAGATWLRYNSPPPYLVRVLIPYSAAAAYIGAAIVSRMPDMPLAVQQSKPIEFSHLEAILRAARDELRTRHIPFVVVVLPSRNWVENPATEHLAPEIMDVARRLDVPALDVSDAVADGARRGMQLFREPPDPHFSVAGNDLIARWLHERLATAAGPPPSQ